MAVFGGTTLGSVFFSSHIFDQQSSFFPSPLRLLPCPSSSSSSQRNSFLYVVKCFSGSATADTDKNSNQSALISAANSLLRDTSDDAEPAQVSSDWKTAKAYCKSGDTFEGEVESYNKGGLLVRFYSLEGFLPYPHISPSRSCKEPQKSIHRIARTLVGSKLLVKIVEADEENGKLILSEKLAVWSKYSQNISVGDVFTGIVGSVEDYGAFIHLRFDDGLFHLTGLVHVSELSWDYVHDVRDVLHIGDEVRVIVINLDKEKSQITLSIKQLEDDPLLETLDKVILKESSNGSPSLSSNNGDTIEPLPGLETILEELLKEDGIEDVKISREGFEKRVVSQDLQLWLSNTLLAEGKCVLLARAGRQVQEICLTTSLDQQRIKKALQRVLQRIP